MMTEMNSRGCARYAVAVLLFVAMTSGCSDSDVGDIVSKGPAGDVTSSLPASLFDIGDETLELRPAPNPERNAFFGDLHVHTTYSFDAYSIGTLATPYDAYRFALGKAIAHPTGFDLQLPRPLDFYAVTDHAMFLGIAPAAGDTSTDISRMEIARPLNNLNDPGNRGILSWIDRLKIFASFLPDFVGAIQDGTLTREDALDVTRAAWLDSIKAAEQFNDPGRFTTFVGYEYTSWAEDFGNLHRNVIFRGSDQLPAVPFSRLHSDNPEDLWSWMDTLRDEGVESLAIPHNSNGSNGQMFELVDWAGNPIDNDYALRRVRNEPLVEITQEKGTSETHPLLSTTDEWADFEIMPYIVATLNPSEPAGSYVRDALRRGLALEQQGVENPYDFGFIGSSDTHNGGAENDETTYVSKLGLMSATADLRGSVPFSPVLGAVLSFVAPDAFREIDGKTYIGAATPTYGASGLAAVWAEENTRGAIYDAFRRKETFATSGPRIKLRFFAGYDYQDTMLKATDVITQAYSKGVSMGSHLLARDNEVPAFLLWALADASSAQLQRLQVVKAWVDAAGVTSEQVYDVACSGSAPVNPQTHRCPDNGARVSTEDCSISGDGEGELRTLWRDPDFDPGERAFYYARVLENPTCRWSTWDAVRAGVPPRKDLATTIQERAWSSPIHFMPAAAERVEMD